MIQFSNTAPLKFYEETIVLKCVNMNLLENIYHHSYLFFRLVYIYSFKWMNKI